MKFDSRIVATSSEYANKTGVEIDYDGTGGENKMSYEESESIQRILTCQLAVEALMNSYGVCGSNSDTMNIIFAYRVH